LDRISFSSAAPAAALFVFSAYRSHVRLALALLVLAPSLAAADDRLTVGAMTGRPISADGTGLAIAGELRWDRLIVPWLELGAGLELGSSTGRSALERVALLPGFAVVTKASSLELRFEERGGWQLVNGTLTLDAIPLSGTESRSFHDEVDVAVGAVLTRSSDLRGRAGLTIDGLYPAGHSSLRVGPFIGVAFVSRL
jgi:hypothetical protein